MDFKSLIPFGGSRGGSDVDPFRSLRRDMDRMLESFGRDWSMPAMFGDTGFLSPKVNIAETDKGLEVAAELPGVDPKNIDVKISDGVLTLTAEHTAEKEEKDERKQYHLVERSYGTFMRRFTLPFEADENKVDATFDKGVLKVMISRSPAAEKQAKRIEIKSSK